MTTLRYPHLYRHTGLVRYAFAAMLARIADGGGVLAVILLCQSSEQYSAVQDGWQPVLLCHICWAHLLPAVSTRPEMGVR